MDTLKKWINESDNIVFFGGAGVSTESGIPDFRSVDGLYNTQYDYPPETILSHDFFWENTQEFYRFYRNKMIYKAAKPNAAHKKLAELESCGKLKGIVTQNIDGLHQLAGSQTVWELHGSIHRNHCSHCHQFYGLDAIENSDDIPRCSCGGVIKPDVVLYGEGLDDNVVNQAVQAIEHCDMLLVGGTSLSVYPAAGLIRYYHGNKLVLINKSHTDYDKYAQLHICGPIGEVLSGVVLS